MAMRCILAAPGELWLNRQCAAAMRPYVKLILTTWMILYILACYRRVLILFLTGLKWHLKSVSKCQDLHIGRSKNILYCHFLFVEDPVVTVNGYLNYSDHINNCHRGVSVLVCCFKSKEHTLLFRVFTACVRPLLACNSAVWSPSEIYISYKSDLWCFVLCVVLLTSIVIVFSLPLIVRPVTSGHSLRLLWPP